ncbi:glycosyltransferase [Pseudomonas sp. Q1-7]|uniref:glycosyltransferase n=1 Tax=Pseudomonas sp. Q1-7 TaxID=3020843 RepID=UPI0022FFF695|nr:glycosyltransferase [Pseudomonas sp. Q1-7]
MSIEVNKLNVASPTGPLVSLVVPAYNAELYVEETIESLLAQSYKNVEIIVINDGSTDATEYVLSKFSGKCVIINQDNCGQAASLNKGWQLSRGELVGYLSADDTLESTAVEQLVAQFAIHKRAIFLYPDYFLMDGSSRRLRSVVAPDFDYRDVVLMGICPVGPGALFKRVVLDSVGGWDPCLRQIPDYDFILRVGLFGEIRRVPGFLAGFRVHNESQTFAASDERKTEEYKYVLRKYFERNDVPWEIYSERPRAEANARILMARLHLRARRLAAALRCLREAMGLNVTSVFSFRSVRLLLNGLFGHYRHWLKMKIRG